MSTSVSSSPLGALVLTRTFDAPRALVFDAWTKPEHLRHWWGQPHGATMPHCTVDLRVGGSIHCCVRQETGDTMWVKGVYREIVAPERLVFDLHFSDPDGNVVEGPPGLARDSVVTATFVERDGRTTVTIEHAGVERASPENQRNYALGWGESLERLGSTIAGRIDRELVHTRELDAP